MAHSNKLNGSNIYIYILYICIYIYIYICIYFFFLSIWQSTQNVKVSLSVVRSFDNWKHIPENSRIYETFEMLELLKCLLIYWAKSDFIQILNYLINNNILDWCYVLFELDQELWCMCELIWFPQYHLKLIQLFLGEYPSLQLLKSLI